MAEQALTVVESPRTAMAGSTPRNRNWFQKGNTISKRGGRPKGSIDWIRELQLAVRTVEKRRCKPFMEHCVERAYANDKVLPHLLDRLVKRLSDPNALLNPANTQPLVIIFQSAETP